MSSIGTLEKSIRVLRYNLEKKGYEANVSVVKLGRNFELGTSYVELGVSDNDDNYIGHYKFLANGYDGVYSYEFGGYSIKKMKENFWEKFNNDIK